MKVLVTGATGYIGSHVCKALKLKGDYVEGWDINFHGEYNDISEYVDRFEKVDVTNIPYTYPEFDAVIHLAGRGVVPQSILEPSDYYRVNTMGTSHILDKVKTNNFIFASTSSAFEMASPYARSKVAAEDIIKEKADGHTIFRFFNVSGSDTVYRQLGSPTHLIRRAAMVATGKISEIEIYGNDYPTHDGTCIRDYIHVDDVCDAIVAAAENGATNTPFECLGSTKGFSVLDVLTAMREVTGHEIPTTIKGRRAGDAVSCIVEDLSNLCNINKSLHDMCLDQYKLEINR